MAWKCKGIIDGDIGEILFELEESRSQREEDKPKSAYPTSIFYSSILIRYHQTTRSSYRLQHLDSRQGHPSPFSYFDFFLLNFLIRVR